ncbi:MAG: efflux RND transporter periplasmic adaptor subunit [Acidobacteria bacterium]|nr:efflux RND transporter periplasmic adaptor subunit [Acidobacteriota bacterium]
MTVAAAAKREVPVAVEAIGNVEAYSTVSIKAQVNGPLQRVHFREGDFVRTGDLLFTIDPSPFQAALSEAEANLARSEAQLAQSQATLKRDSAQAKYLQAQASRSTALFKQGIFSRDQTEQVQASADAQDAGVRADEAGIKGAEAAVVAGRAAVATAKIQLGYTVIRSPIAGRTGNLAVKEGNLVAANNTELTTINQVQPVYVTFSIPETHLAVLKQHMAQGQLPVSASPQDGTPGEETGRLTFVDNTVDPATGTIRLKGTFPNPNRKLWPGGYVRVTLRLATRHNAVVVPAQALQIGQNGAFLYVVKPDSTVEARPVTTGARVDQDIVIESGLQPGEKVVTEGQLRLAPGMRVRLRGAGERAPRSRPRT